MIFRVAIWKGCFPVGASMSPISLVLVPTYFASMGDRALWSGHVAFFQIHGPLVYLITICFHHFCHYDLLTWSFFLFVALSSSLPPLILCLKSRPHLLLYVFHQDIPILLILPYYQAGHFMCHKSFCFTLVVVFYVLLVFYSAFLFILLLLLIITFMFLIMIQRSGWNAPQAWYFAPIIYHFGTNLYLSTIIDRSILKPILLFPYRNMYF